MTSLGGYAKTNTSESLYNIPQPSSRFQGSTAASQPDCACTSFDWVRESWQFLTAHSLIRVYFLQHPCQWGRRRIFQHFLAPLPNFNSHFKEYSSDKWLLISVFKCPCRWLDVFMASALESEVVSLTPVRSYWPCIEPQLFYCTLSTSPVIIEKASLRINCTGTGGRRMTLCGCL